MEISRVDRSTLAAEACACANGIEVGLWRHSMLVEIFTGNTKDLRPRKDDTFPHAQTIPSRECCELRRGR